MIRNLFLVRPETIQLSVWLRSLLSISLCLVGRVAAHQPNARSAQTGVADKLMDAERPMIQQHGSRSDPCSLPRMKQFRSQQPPLIEAILDRRNADAQAIPHPSSEIDRGRLIEVPRRAGYFPYF